MNFSQWWKAIRRNPQREWIEELRSDKSALASRVAVLESENKELHAKVEALLSVRERVRMKSQVPVPPPAWYGEIDWERLGIRSPEEPNR